jgi:hypothetical protein
MEKDIFVCQKNINDIIKNKELNESLENVLVEYDAKEYRAKDQLGKAITTCHLNDVFFQIKNNDLLINWLEYTLNQYCKIKEKSYEKYKINRMWCNRMFTGCEVKPHVHYPVNFIDFYNFHFVVVLYYQIPENSSNIIFIDSDEILNSWRDYEVDKINILKVNSGLSVLHDARIIHAIDKHKSKGSRTVFVFDIEMELYDNTV